MARKVPTCAHCGKPAPTPGRVVLNGKTFCGWDCADKYEESE